MYIISYGGFGVKLILTADPFDCAQDRFRGLTRIFESIMEIGLRRGCLAGEGAMYSMKAG